VWFGVRDSAAQIRRWEILLQQTMAGTVPSYPKGMKSADYLVIIQLAFAL